MKTFLKTIFLIMILALPFQAFTQGASVNYSYGRTDQSVKLIKINLIIHKIKSCKVYLAQWFSNDSIQPLDTIAYQHPGITFQKRITEPVIYQLSFSKYENTILFIADANMTIQTSFAEPSSTQIEGSPLTKEWEEFNANVAHKSRLKMIEIYQKKEQAQKEGNMTLVAELEQENGRINLSYDQQLNEYIWDHPNSFVSVILLAKINQNRRRHYYNHLTDEMKKTSLANYIMLPIIEEESVAEGSLVSDFEKVDLNGTQLTAQSLKGNYTLIDFWGTWCGPCIALLPQMRTSYARYKNKPVKWISVAYEFDSDPTKVKEIIVKEQLIWQHVIETKDNLTEDSLIKLFAINAYPTTIVVDPKGVILFRGSGKDGFQEACQILDNYLNK